MAYFPYLTFVSVVSFSDVTIPAFAFIELVSPYNKKNITRWLDDMNFMFEWQEEYLTRSLRSLVRYSSCHSNIKFISSHHRVISSIYLLCFLSSYESTWKFAEENSHTGLWITLQKNITPSSTRPLTSTKNCVIDSAPRMASHGDILFCHWSSRYTYRSAVKFCSVRRADPDYYCLWKPISHAIPLLPVVSCKLSSDSLLWFKGSHSIPPSQEKMKG